MENTNGKQEKSEAYSVGNCC